MLDLIAETWRKHADGLMFFAGLVFILAMFMAFVIILQLLR